MSKKDKPSEGCTMGGGGLLRPQWCLTPRVPAGLSLCDGSHLKTGKELSRDWLVRVLQGAPLFFLWCQPRVEGLRAKDVPGRMLLSRLIYGFDGCWPWQMGRLPSLPTPAGAQVVPLNLLTFSHFLLLWITLLILTLVSFSIFVQLSSPVSFHPFFPTCTSISALLCCVPFLASFSFHQSILSCCPSHVPIFCSLTFGGMPLCGV